MNEEYQTLTIENVIKPGLINELFQYELRKVLKNIEDENTSTKDKRKITIEIEISSSNDRKMGAIVVGVNSKLAGLKKQDGSVFFVKGKAYTHNLEEQPLFDDTGENVVNFNKGQENDG